MVLKCAQ